MGNGNGLQNWYWSEEHRKAQRLAAMQHLYHRRWGDPIPRRLLWLALLLLAIAVGIAKLAGWI